MNPALRKKLVFASLPIAIIIAVIHFSGENSSHQPAGQTQLADSPPLPSGTTAAPIPAVDFAMFDTLSWGRDPFEGTPVVQPSLPVAENAPEWKLGGIMYGDGEPTAVINGKIVTRGDEINGAKILKIGPKSVTIEIDGEAKTVSIAGDKS